MGCACQSGSVSVSCGCGRAPESCFCQGEMLSGEIHTTDLRLMLSGTALPLLSAFADLQDYFKYEWNAAADPVTGKIDPQPKLRRCGTGRLFDFDDDGDVGTSLPIVERRFEDEVQEVKEATLSSLLGDDEGKEREEFLQIADAQIAGKLSETELSKFKAVGEQISASFSSKGRLNPPDDAPLNDYDIPDITPTSTTVQVPIEEADSYGTNLFLSTFDKIDLGDHYALKRLVAEVPAGYQPNTDPQDMIDAFLPEWEAMRRKSVQDGFGWEGAKALLNYKADHIPGLFWTDDYYYNAILCALVTLYGYSPMADIGETFTGADKCDYSPSDLKKHFRHQWFTIKVPGIFCKGCVLCKNEELIQFAITNDGEITSPAEGDVRVMPAGHIAWAFNSDWFPLLSWVSERRRINICDAMRLEAYLADYYFWWAHRLYSYVLDKEYSLDSYAKAWLWNMGKRCAAAALTEIVELSALLLHEYCHLTGSPYHCNVGEDSDLEVEFLNVYEKLIELLYGIESDVSEKIEEILSKFGGFWLRDESLNSPMNCCQYVIEHMYRHRVYARLGLPISSCPDAEHSNIRQNRWAVNSWFENFDGKGACNDTSYVNGNHASLEEKNHLVSISWEVQKSDKKGVGNCVSKAISGFRNYQYHEDEDSDGGTISKGSGEYVPSKESVIPDVEREDKYGDDSGSDRYA